ncbi:MAG: hypothetical protein H0W69_11435 [Gemmatimonadaceae bacterium]|nr:hypothetical protein [Gemmatimonadaceae bacterium]
MTRRTMEATRRRNVFIYGVFSFNGTLSGRFFSNSSKILRYSSAHDDGLTNA